MTTDPDASEASDGFKRLMARVEEKYPHLKDGHDDFCPLTRWPFVDCTCGANQAAADRIVRQVRQQFAADIKEILGK